MREKSRENKNDQIIKSFYYLENEVDFSNFTEYTHYFTKLCELIPNLTKESIDINYNNLDEYSIKTIKTKKGFVYMMVISNKIFKIGHSTKSLKERISSYNCGKEKNRKNGTCSTTNYFTLQSILKINKNVEIYTYFLPTFNLDIFGKEIKEIPTSPSKVAEGILIKAFEIKFNKKPIGCVQK